MANYLSPDIRGAHLDKYEKLESTKVDIEAKIKYTETVTEDDANETMEEAQADASLSPNSKLIKRHQENIARIAKRCPENIASVVKCVKLFLPKVLRKY